MIARERKTHKLRMNQNVPIPSLSKFKSPKDKMYQWMAYDMTITAEKGKQEVGFSLWLIRFQSNEMGQEFQSAFEAASNNNGSMTSDINSVEIESIEQKQSALLDPDAFNTNKIQSNQQPANYDNASITSPVKSVKPV